MQPSEHIESASPISSPVKWKVRKVSAIRDFPKSFKCSRIHITDSSTHKSMDSVDEMMVNNDHSPDQDIGSQEKVVVNVKKAVLKPDELENEEVNARVDSNAENVTLRIGIYPPPKQRNVPLVRDFPLGLKKFSEQINQSENDIDDDIQSMGSLMNDEDDVHESDESIMNDEDDIHESEESLMNDQDDVHESDESLMNDQDDVHESNESLMNDEDDVHESEESLMNDEDDVHEFEEGLTNDQDDVHESEESLMMNGQDDVHESEECLLNDEDETVKEDGTDLTGYKRLSKLNIPRRRVSAVRCFPPGCGRNAVRLSEEELKKALAESKNFHCLSCSGPELEIPFIDEEIEHEEETEMVEDNFGITDDKEETMEEKVEERGDIVIALRASRFSSTEKTTAKRKFEEEEENVEKEEKEMMEETEALKTDGKEEMMKAKLQGERMVVKALRASRCSLIQNARAKSTAKIMPIKNEEIARTDSKQGERRMVVLGLMASSQCIWRNNPRKKVRK